MQPLFDIDPISKAQMKRNRASYTTHLRNEYRAGKRRHEMMGASSAPMKRRTQGSRKMNVSLDSDRPRDVYHAAWCKITEAMNRYDAIILPCPHCEFAIIRRVVIHREPLPTLTLSFDHRCPPKRAGWLEITNNYSCNITYEQALEIACGTTSLWNIGVNA